MSATHRTTRTLVSLSLACNNPENGMPQGFTETAYIGAITLVGGRVVTREEVYPACSPPARSVRVGRLVVWIRGHQEWYGNWCWNAYAITQRDAVRVVNYLLARGWHSEEAPLDFHDQPIAKWKPSWSER